MLIHRFGQVTFDIARMFCLGRLHQGQPAFILGHRSMHDTLGHDGELPGFKLGCVVLILDAQPTFDDVEKFIFIIMLMPNELASDFGDLEILIIDPADDLGRPILGHIIKVALRFCTGIMRLAPKLNG